MKVCARTLTGRLISMSAQLHQRATKRTGCRPLQARPGSRISGSTARWSPTSIGVGICRISKQPLHPVGELYSSRLCGCHRTLGRVADPGYRRFAKETEHVPPFVGDKVLARLQGRKGPALEFGEGLDLLQ